MTDVSKVTPRGPANLNCAVLFSCDEPAYQDLIAQVASVHGVHIYFIKSSPLRLILEERGFQG